MCHHMKRNQCSYLWHWLTKLWEHDIFFYSNRISFWNVQIEYQTWVLFLEYCTVSVLGRKVFYCITVDKGRNPCLIITGVQQQINCRNRRHDTNKAIVNRPSVRYVRNYSLSATTNRFIWIGKTNLEGCACHNTFIFDEAITGMKIFWAAQLEHGSCLSTTILTVYLRAMMNKILNAYNTMIKTTYEVHHLSAL